MSKRIIAAKAPGPGRSRPQDVDRHVGARMRERRIMLGLTQHQMAELIGVTYQQAHKYEKGINRIAAGRLFQIAQALGIEVGYFFEGADRPRIAAINDRGMQEHARIVHRMPENVRKAYTGLARAIDDGQS